jgi:preprotein translocase subunit SecA
VATELTALVEALDPESLLAASADLRERANESSSPSGELLTEALAVAREAIRRTTGSWPSDLQVMHASRMQAGHLVGVPVTEGRGPVLMLAAYVHCLVRPPVHVVAVDDTVVAALAAEMTGVMNLLGVTVAAIGDSPEFANDRSACGADIVIGSPARFCFDYLKDFQATSPDELIQPSRRVAIVADADVTLIEQATLIHVITGEFAADRSQYGRMKQFAEVAMRGIHYDYVPGTSQLLFTAVGLELTKANLGITDREDLSLLAVVQQLDDALIAKDWIQRGVDYEVLDGQVRPTPWLGRQRRYPVGVLQAIQAKEGLVISDEQRPMARMRVTDYFRLYDTLTGIATLPVDAFAVELRERYRIEPSGSPGGRNAAGKMSLLLSGRLRRRDELATLAALAAERRSRDDATAAVEVAQLVQVTALRSRFLTTASPQDEIRPILDESSDEDAAEAYRRQEERFGPDNMDRLARLIPLTVLAKLWREHLVELDILMQRFASGAGEPGSWDRYDAAAANRYATMLVTFRQLVTKHLLDPSIGD